MKILIIVLVLVTVLSVVALFLRGFNFNTYARQLRSQSLETPAIKVWLVETSGYHDKIDAYKAGVRAEKQGLGVYALKDGAVWSWVAAVCLSKEEAEEVKSKSESLADAVVREYEIKTKKINVPAEVVEICHKVLTLVKTDFEVLLNLRTLIVSNTSISNLILELTDIYNQIKSNTQTLQKMNIYLKSPLIANIIYTANVCLLSLNDLILGNNDFSLAAVNTALLNTIFSLDNF